MGHLLWGLFSLLSPSRPGPLAPTVHKDQALGGRGSALFPAPLQPVGVTALTGLRFLCYQAQPGPLGTQI